MKNHIYALGAMSVVSLVLVGCGQTDVENRVNLSDSEVCKKITEEIKTLETHLVTSGIQIDYSNLKAHKNEGQELIMNVDYNRLETADKILNFLSTVQQEVRSSRCTNKVIGGIEQFEKAVSEIEKEETMAKIIFDLVLSGFDPQDMAELVKHDFLKPEKFKTPRYLSFNYSNINWVEGENNEAKKGIEESSKELIDLRSKLDKITSGFEKMEKHNESLFLQVQGLNKELISSSDKERYLKTSLEEFKVTNRNLIEILSKLFKDKVNQEELFTELENSKERIKVLEESLEEFKLKQMEQEKINLISSELGSEYSSMTEKENLEFSSTVN